MLVLVVDDKHRIEPVVREALQDLGVTIRAVAKVVAAKQFLVQTIPDAIVFAAEIGGDTAAGGRFCREIRGHESFALIPLILVADELTDDLLKEAADAKAQGFVPWPSPPEVFAKRLKPLLGIGVEAVALVSPAPVAPPIVPAAAPKPAAVLPTATPPVAAKPVTAPAVQGSPGAVATRPVSQPAAPQLSSPVAPVAAAVSRPVQTSSPPAGDTDPNAASVDDKVRRAQQILATILHSLKTSDLLQVVELEDIPHVVLQMAQKVCEHTPAGASASLEQAFNRPNPAAAKAAVNKPEAARPAATPKTAVKVEMDLDSIFGLKKK